MLWYISLYLKNAIYIDFLFIFLILISILIVKIEKCRKKLKSFKKIVDIELRKCYIIWATAGNAIEMIFEN